jgi:hypothetical protein
MVLLKNAQEKVVILWGQDQFHVPPRITFYSLAAEAVIGCLTCRRLFLSFR